jgi:hypothetical protein
MIPNFASAVASGPCSESWVTHFLHRHSNQIISQWVTDMNSNLHNAESGYKHRVYFDILRQKIAEYCIEPAHTYNMDEKVFTVRVLLNRTLELLQREQNYRSLHATALIAPPAAS